MEINPEKGNRWFLQKEDLLLSLTISSDIRSVHVLITDLTELLNPRVQTIGGAECLETLTNRLFKNCKFATVILSSSGWSSRANCLTFYVNVSSLSTALVYDILLV